MGVVLILLMLWLLTLIAVMLSFLLNLDVKTIRTDLDVFEFGIVLDEQEAMIISFVCEGDDWDCR